MSEKFSSVIQSKWLLLPLCFVLGAVTILAVRFYSYKVESVHYHANFAIFINGEREKLDNPLLYEEVEMCTQSKTPKPTERAHMHDKISDVVHIEDSSVTWGNFMQNIGYGIGDNYFATPSRTFVTDDTNKLQFILNGEIVSSIYGKVIGDKDRLLIDYGTTTKDDLQNAFASVANTAEEYNNKNDPATCSGHDETTTKDRLRNLF